MAMAPSHAWTRDGGSSRGVAAPSRGRGASRGRGKRVWSRTEAEERECDAQRPPGDLDPDAPAFVPKRARISTQESLARELQRKQKEAERLKMELEAKRRAMEEEKVSGPGTKCLESCNLNVKQLTASVRNRRGWRRRKEESR